MSKSFIQRLQQGDDQAFRELVEEFQQLVYCTCLGIIHKEEDADDVTQEVFIEAFHSVHKFREESKVSTWLYRISINKSLNFVRDAKKNKLFRSFDDEDIRIDHIVCESTDTGLDSLLENKRKKRMDAAIDSLPKNQRTAFVLHKINDLTYKEIAEIMNLSLSSIESLIFRAKKNLQKKLMNFYHKGYL